MTTTSRTGIAEPANARLMAGVAAVFFLFGALLVAASLALPAEVDADRVTMALVLTSPLALGLGLLLAGERLPPAGLHALPVAATAMLSTLIHLSGDPGSPISLLFVWVVGWAATFLTPRAVAAHTLLVSAAYAGVLLALAPAPSVAARWLLTVGTLAVAATLIALLTRTMRAQTRSLEAAARTDSLTGLANRRSWEELLPRELGRSRREGSPVSVAFLDLDGFKEFNDLRGHQAGDRLLQGAASAWEARLRSTDLLARHGGDEFALILAGCALPEAQRLVEELRRMVPAEVSCSAGVAEWDRAELPEELVARADTALYAAKRQGRDRLVPMSALEA